MIEVSEYFLVDTVLALIMILSPITLAYGIHMFRENHGLNRRNKDE